MDSAGVAAVLVAAVGAVQVILLAVLNQRQREIARNVDGHLSRLETQRATPAELLERVAVDRQTAPVGRTRQKRRRGAAGPKDTID